MNTLRNIFFDLCAIPVYLIILWTCCARKLTRGRINRAFLLITLLSLACTVLDIAMEYTVNPLPLSRAAVAGGMAISTLYLVLRHGTLLTYFIWLFHMTRTEYRIRPLFCQVLILLPYAVSVLLLAQNLFTMNVFSVSAADGYRRERLMTVLYVIAALYGVAGLACCVSCRRFLSFHKWFSVISVYLLTFLAVTVQLVFPHLLVEMFSTSVALLMILLHVMRPEERMDPTLGVRSWKAYQEDLANLLRIRQPVQILAGQLVNADELRGYLGDERYDALVLRGMESFRSQISRRPGTRMDIYFERPGNVYFVLENEGPADSLQSEMEKAVRKSNGFSPREGIRTMLKMCLIRVPEDLKDLKEILGLGHRFPLLGRQDQQLFLARDLVGGQDYRILSHIDEILERAIHGDSLEIHYQPIRDLKENRFRSAEALARLRDPEYGLIPPVFFIPAAEKSGLIIALGEKILEAVFRFIHEHDLKALGLEYIDINLSVAQCLDSHFPGTVRRLQQQYQVDPSQVCFEITETTFDHITAAAHERLRALRILGYTFALDDYGVGYSNIQRLSRIHFRLIKIDKSMVDELSTESGRLILRNTIHMMHDLRKQVVAEGVETEEALRALADMSADLVQGFWFSKPLPEAQFLSLLRRP